MPESVMLKSAAQPKRKSVSSVKEQLKEKKKQKQEVAESEASELRLVASLCAG